MIILALVVSCAPKDNHDGFSKETISHLSSSLEKGKVSQDSLERFYQRLGSDSIKKYFLIKVSYFHLTNKDSLEFRNWNSKLLEYSKVNSDTSSLAEAYWDLGSYFTNNERYDSAYYYYRRSSELYYELENDFYNARMLLNQALIQSRANDYLGSEITSFEAIKILKAMGKDKQLYLAYNNLGVIHNNIGNFKQSLEYHQIAKSYNENEESPYYKITNLNNIGVAYKSLRQYQSAINSFQTAIRLEEGMNPRLKARLIDNLGHSYILDGKIEKGLDLVQEALLIRNKINHESGIVISYIHLGDYYRIKGSNQSAIDYYVDAIELAEKDNMYQKLAEIYLSLVEVDQPNEAKYLKAHIELTDQLRREERSIQNQFVRIRYETDQIIRRADNLSQQKSYLIIGIVLVLLLFFLTYIIQRQNAGNKKLILERKQQDANERIYELLLRSQQKYEEGSLSERKRISRELHDSVLSKFFGIRINLEVLNRKKGDEIEEKRSVYHQSLKDIEKEIRDISHKLNAEYEFSEVSFLDILREMFDEIEKVEDFQIQFQNNSVLNWVNIRNNIKINLIRIIQESLQNIRKHAKAEIVEVILEFNNESLNVDIKDNGVGFDVNKTKKGIGIRNIKDRVKEIQGEFVLESTEKGTSIRISIAKKYL